MTPTTVVKAGGPAALRTPHSAFRTPKALMLLAVLLAALGGPRPAAGDTLNVTADAYVNGNGPTQQGNNYGGKSSPDVWVGKLATYQTIGFLQFDALSKLPAGTTAAKVYQATLKLFLSAATIPINVPSFNVSVHAVTASWTETGVTFNNKPAYDTTPAGSFQVGKVKVNNVSVAEKQVNKTVDVTALVKAWLNGAPNYGVALDIVATEPNGVSAYFDSKDKTGTSHPATLEVTLLPIPGAAGEQGAKGPPPSGLPRGPAQPNTITTVESGEFYSPSIASGPNGLLISYVERAVDGRLRPKVAYCKAPDCNTVIPSDIHAVSDPLASTQRAPITLGNEGNGLISYTADSASPTSVPSCVLKVAHCNDAGCTTSATSEVANHCADQLEILNISSTISGDGNALISHSLARPIFEDGVMVVHCQNNVCSSADSLLEIVPPLSSDSDSRYPDIAGVGGLGVIGYSLEGLKVAHCNDVKCTAVGVVTLDVAGGVPSMTVGEDGRPIIAYLTSGGVKVAHCKETDCSVSADGTAADITLLDSSGGLEIPSITIGTDNLALITYRQNITDEHGEFIGSKIKVAHCTDVKCTKVTIPPSVVIDGNTQSASTFGSRLSMTVGNDGLPVIAYIGCTTPCNSGSAFALKVLHCGNTFCIDYLHPR